MTRRISVTGLGYVGLPVATTFAWAGIPVVAFDIDARRIVELLSGQDRTREVEPHRLINKCLHFTDKVEDLRSADFHIVTVPTPIDASKQPNLGPLQRASAMIGSIVKKGDIVVYESTVYPGAIEEDCAPSRERVSRLVSGRDFTLGYSPERINPGDKTHRFETITKVGYRLLPANEAVTV